MISFETVAARPAKITDADIREAFETIAPELQSRFKHYARRFSDREAAERKNALEKQSFDTLQGARFRTEPLIPYSTSAGTLAEKVEIGKKRY